MTKRSDAPSIAAPLGRGTDTGTDALLLALGSAARSTYGRARIDAEQGYRLRARRARRDAARLRRLMVRQALAGVSERRAAEQSAAAGALQQVKATLALPERERTTAVILAPAAALPRALKPSLEVQAHALQMSAEDRFTSSILLERINAYTIGSEPIGPLLGGVR